MPTVRASDLDIHYTERGHGPPMVLVHGGLATAKTMWNDADVDRMAARFRVLLPDSRGHGETRSPASELGYPQMADDLAAFCGALDLERPVVVGYSDGAQTGIELGLRHPGVARAIVLGGVVIRRSPAYLQMLADMGMTVPGEVDLPTMRAAFGDHFAMMVTGPHAHWETLLRQLSRLWLTAPEYSDAQLATIRDACLVICGDRDLAVVDDVVRLARALPVAELAIVPDSSHGAASKPLFWTNVLDFLDRH